MSSEYEPITEQEEEEEELTIYNLKVKQQSEQFKVLDEQSSFDADRPYVEYSSQVFEIEVPYFNERLQEIIRNSGRDTDFERDVLYQSSKWMAVEGREMHNNKRYDYIVDLSSTIFNWRHVIGLKIPKNMSGIFSKDLVIELISDPVLTSNVNSTTLFNSIQDLELLSNSKSFVNIFAPRYPCFFNENQI